ncbi:MAG: hypothetical protein A2255_00425 [Candidatus Melainabacteria bacterium RIFOXYA2_FULL_32_9]|nr:MAG: hypothetical protein A2255_00425 [Candidatus Melainabacteria bacterium RIFOXYA2_FULL_32_9]
MACGKQPHRDNNTLAGKPLSCNKHSYQYMERAHNGIWRHSRGGTFDIAKPCRDYALALSAKS